MVRNPKKSLANRDMPRQAYAKRAMRAIPKEPNTVSYVTATEISTEAIDGDGIEQVKELLVDPAVWRIEPCCGDLSTAIDIAAVVGAHPNTLTTAARVCYVGTDGIQSLPIVNGIDAQRDTREAAVELFFSAFTEEKSDASLAKSELFDGFCDWHLNLTGQSISRLWFGRALAELDVEPRGGHFRNRTWTAEALEGLQN